MIFLLTTEGQMGLRETVKTCMAEKWVPLVSYDDNGKTTLVSFSTPNVAKKFRKRNLPKQWLCALMTLDKKDLEIVKENGWAIHEMNWPQKMNNLSIDVLELKTTPNFTAEDTGENLRYG